MTGDDTRLLELMRTRRSVRKYLRQEVEDDKIRLVLEAARIAPSWANMQCWRFIVVRDPALREKVCDAVVKGTRINFWIKNAPALVVCCADPKESGVNEEQPYYLVDCAIAMEHLVLMAAELGLGTCWVGVFDEKAVKEALSIPSPMRVVALTPLGYERTRKKGIVDVEGMYEKVAKKVMPKKRRALGEIASFDKYGNKATF